jgi:myosin heavy subunit
MQVFLAKGKHKDLDYEVACQVTGVRGHHVELQALDDKSQMTVQDNGTDFKVMSHTSVIGVEDMIQLQDLHEGSLLYNIGLRYKQKLIYTFTGSILIAVNPYQDFDVYRLKEVRMYQNQLIGTLPPHIFAIGAGALMSMQQSNRDQCIIISGESGAGKTASTKLIMQYLAAVNPQKSLIREQILESSPMLESFGNAKTSCIMIKKGLSAVVKSGNTCWKSLGFACSKQMKEITTSFMRC